jgi:uridine kinase
MQRALMLARLCELIRQVERPHPVRVAVDGMAAAGKTVLADELEATLRQCGREVIRASVDGFHRERAERYRRGYDSPEGYYCDAFDYEAIRTVLLLPLGPGGDRQIRLETFDLLADAPLQVPARSAQRDAVLLCDGVFLLRNELSAYWDFRIFVLVDEHVAVQRACGRDQALLGPAEAVQRRYWARYVPAHRIYLNEARPTEKADVVVDNNDLTDPVLHLQ